MQTQAQQIRILTLGCVKNKVDSERLFTQLAAAGHSVAATEGSITAHDTLVINTCGFIESAKEQSIDVILRAIRAKEEGQIRRVFVMGCLSARYKDELQKQIPKVDAYFGTRDLKDILKAIGTSYNSELINERKISTPAHYAYLKISEGCDRPCSFCAIPQMRGVHRSRPIEDLLQEANHLAQQGVKELILIAQDSTYYGIDLYGRRRLAELMDRLSEIETIQWIRLHYAYPNGFPVDVLEVMAARKNICKYLDMPLQHASEHVLRRMRRPMKRDRLDALLDTARSKVPGLAFRTTFMVGFPGEDQRDFEELLSFVEAQRFDRLGCFTYSHEDQTHAQQEYKDHVSPSLKMNRYNQLMALQHSLSLQKNQALLGRRMVVLIEEQKNKNYIGRTSIDSPEIDNRIHVQSPTTLPIGDFVEVEVTRAEAYDLYGKTCVQ